MMEEEIDKIVKDLKRYPEVMAIILFGSHARGKAKPISDIDIAVITKDSNKSLETEKSLEAEISSFSSNILDVVPFFRLPLYIQFEVFKYGKTLFVRDEEYLMQVKRDVLREYLDISYLYERMSRRILAR
jgi:hypothetical protein